jgi:hypothetical protein
MDLEIPFVKRKSARASSSAESLHAAPKSSEAGLDDDWGADEQLRHIERVLRINKKRHRRNSASSADKTFRVDSSHGEPAARHRAAPDRIKKPTSKTKKTPKRGSSFLSFLTWTAILLGTAAFAGGGISLGCSILGNRIDAWNFGLPFVVGGQIVLLAGLVLQLDRVWRDNRAAAAKLEEFDEELHDLKTAAALLETERNPRAGAFYAHYAGGANPQLLFADLKSQLDLLAVKIAGEVNI